MSTPDSHERKKEVYKTAFAKYDKDNSGLIDKNEILQLLHDLGWAETEEEAQKAIDGMDVNKDGQLELEEFMRWSEYAFKHKALKAHNRSESLSLKDCDKTPSKQKEARRPSLIGTTMKEEDEGVE